MLKKFSYLILTVILLQYQNCSNGFQSMTEGGSPPSGTLQIQSVTDHQLQVHSTGPVQVKAVGNIQSVFHHDTDACEPLDIPDNLAHAFRNAAGQVVLTISHYKGNYRNLGADLNSVTHDCHPTYASQNDTTFADDLYHEWIAAPYTLDGQHVVSLVHNEWYANLVNPSCTGGWVNSVTMVTSDDGGANYAHPADYKVRIPGVNWSNSFNCDGQSDGQTIYGSFLPTGIIPGPDNFYYSFFVTWADPRGLNATGTCLMRTDNLDAATAWNVWTGTDWQPARSTFRCAGIDFAPIGNMPGWLSVKYSTYFHKYIALLDNGAKSGTRLFYALSDDLLNWSKALPLANNFGNSNGAAQYWSFLDPTDTSRNFDNIGQDPYIYFTVFLDNDLNRDMVRQQIHFENTAAPAPAPTPSPAPTPAPTPNPAPAPAPTPSPAPAPSPGPAPTPAPAPTPPPTHVIFRYLNNKTSGHYYAKSSNAPPNSNFSLEGGVFSLFDNPANLRQGVYRCYYNAGYFLSNDSGCEGRQGGTLIGYSATQATVNTHHTLFRCLNGQGQHFESVKAVECINAGFTVEGSLGEVP